MWIILSYFVANEMSAVIGVFAEMNVLFVYLYFFVHWFIDI